MRKDERRLGAAAATAILGIFAWAVSPCAAASGKIRENPPLADLRKDDARAVGIQEEGRVKSASQARADSRAGSGDELSDAPGSLPARRDAPGLWLSMGSFALLSFLVYRWISEDEKPPTIYR